MNENEKMYLEYMANKMRIQSLQMTAEAGSGHPTSCLSAAEIMSVLFFRQMRWDPHNPTAPGNDLFVMSKGHAAPIQYAALYNAGTLKDEDLMTLRKFDSILEGHPVPRIPGVLLATGSLGQGLSAGLGLSLSMKMKGIDRWTYVLLGDGEMAEGSVWEAFNLAPYLGLNNIVAILDMNRLGQSDPTLLGWDGASYQARADSFGWHALIADGNDVEELWKAFMMAQQDDRPSLIIARTTKGQGASPVADKGGKHGKPVEGDDLKKAIHEIESSLENPGSHKPDNFISVQSGKTDNERYKLETEYSKGDEVATRDAYGAALKKLGEMNPDMAVLDGDVKNSTRTREFFKAFPERSIECYIAEQNMIGIAMGLQAGGISPFAATFAAFLTRAHDQIRMAGYSDADLKLAGSHTGVSIGQDGPSQMGLEDFSMIRPVQGSVVLSPCDAVSAEKLTAAAAAYRGISYLRTIRGKTPVIYDNSEQFKIGGSKVVRSAQEEKGIILATGITVHEALKAAELLKDEGIEAGVIDVYSVKPLDGETLRKAAATVRFFLTVEDHYPEGGMGEAVAALMSGEIPVRSIAVTKRPHSGAPDKLLAENNLDSQGIARRFKALLEEEE
ncbi:MAG: transketolase [Spirochaetia bacterium]